MKYQFQVDGIDPDTAHGKALQLIEPGSSILECGCASGYLTRYLSKEMHCRVFIVEKDREGFEKASEYAEDGVCADLTSPRWADSFSDNSFDYIMFLDVLEHLTDPLPVLERSVCLLKDNGKIIVSIPNIGHNDIIIKLINNEWEYTPLGLLDDTHVHFWGEKDIRPFFEKAGLEIVRCDYTYCPTTQTEQDMHNGYVDAALYRTLREREYGEVYQFIISAQKSGGSQRAIEGTAPTRSSSLEQGSLAEILMENRNWQKSCAESEDRIRGLEAQILADSEERKAAAQERLAYAQEKLAFEKERQLFSERCITYEMQIKQYLRDTENAEKRYEELERRYSQAKESLETEKNTSELLGRRVELTEEKMRELESACLTLEKKAASLSEENGKIRQENDELLKEKSKMSDERQRYLAENENLALRCYVYENSRSWKMTKPYRALGDFLKKLFHITPKQVYLPTSTGGDPVSTTETKDGRPLVTVAIPVYDRTDVLIESIESVLHQTYPRIEIIAVCDGSPPETIDIVKRYERQRKIRAFYYADNSGNAVRGRNRAIQEARGKYLAFQDSDDIAEPDRIALSVAAMERENCDVVYGGWRALVEDRTDTGLENGQEIFSPDCDLDLLLQVCVPCQSTVMARTKALRSVGGLKSAMRYREDHELWIRLAYNGYRFKSIPSVLTNLRLHGSNLELTFKKEDERWKELMLSEYKNPGSLKKRVAFVISGCDISGGMKIICTYANYLKSNGFYVCFLCTGTIGSLDWFPDQQVELLPCSDPPDDLDVVVSTFWTTNECAQQIQAARHIYLVQSDERKFYSQNSPEALSVEKTYRIDQEVIVIAGWMKEWLQKEFGIDAKLLRNGINYEALDKAVPLIPRGERLRILIEGAPNSSLKGVGDAFKIAEQTGAEIWYVNPTGEKAPYRADRVFDRVPNDMMPSIYASCHILLKTSRYESFCLPALEMMGTGGVPVIARVNGIDDYLRDGVNGFVFDQGAFDKAKRIIERLAKDPIFLASVGSEAKKTAKEFDFQTTLDEMMHYFEDE